MQSKRCQDSRHRASNRVLQEVTRLERATSNRIRFKVIRRWNHQFHNGHFKERRQ
nr:MAG TPA: hypothetical protein [Caudoviricetes sp.]